MSRPFIIILCGRFYPVKAMDRMIRVAKWLKDDGFVFEVRFIGTGELQDQLKQMVEDYGLSKEIKFMGFLNPPYEEMSKADVFVSTSLTEGYPVNICEALCLGLPIVATRCAGIEEILGKDSEFGLVAEQNEKSIYECIKIMLTNETTRNHYRQKALQISQQFCFENTMSAVYSVL